MCITRGRRTLHCSLIFTFGTHFLIKSFLIEYEIKPKNKLRIDIHELWEYRELFYIFTWRDIKIKYKQTILGALWAVLQPFVMMVVFTVFFGNMLHVPTD